MHIWIVPWACTYLMDAHQSIVRAKCGTCTTYHNVHVSSHVLHVRDEHQCSEQLVMSPECNV